MNTVQLHVILKTSEKERNIKEDLTIGQVSERAGVATSAIRFYEDINLISSTRTEGNQRRYDRSVLRTVSVIKAAQEVGLSLRQIAEALDSLPEGRTPTKRDWARLATGWRSDLDSRIKELTALRDDLADSIGCGCLSLRSCALFNPDDRASATGTGARYIVGDPRPLPIEK
jgi:MerR family redox-sensitive transcriptional activator SoxR